MRIGHGAEPKEKELRLIALLGCHAIMLLHTYKGSLLTKLLGSMQHPAVCILSLAEKIWSVRPRVGSCTVYMFCI